LDEPRPGVVVLAKRWAFRGMNDNLAILGSNFGPVRNVTILGKGALWKMWKHDCEWPPRAQPEGLWRYRGKTSDMYLGSQASDN
jgi:hypothetical protein